MIMIILVGTVLEPYRKHGTQTMCILLGETQRVLSLKAHIVICGICLVFCLGRCFCGVAVSVLSSALVTRISGRDLCFFCPLESLPAHSLPLRQRRKAAQRAGR